MRFSIRYKVLGLVAGVLLVAMVTYVYFAVRLFTRDKLAYVYDLNATLAGTFAAEVDLTLATFVDKLVYFAIEQGDARSDVEAAARRLFAGDRDVLSIELRSRHGGEWQPRFAWHDPQRLASFNLAADDVAAARLGRPLSWDAVLADGLLVQNSS